MATWPYHVISLVITSNDISLSPSIAFTYRLVPDGSLFWYTKPYSSIVGNQLSFITLLKSASAAIPPFSYCSFDSYLPTSRLLGLDLSSSGSVGIWITPQSLAIDEGLQNRTSLGWHLRCEDVTPLWSVGARKKNQIFEYPAPSPKGYNEEDTRSINKKPSNPVGVLRRKTKRSMKYDWLKTS